jgi:glutamate-1-semialdehyde 2,1-aminomutase
MGLMPPVEGFLELLRNKADEQEALLIFDEVVTGFRVAEGGAQERTGVQADLTVLGKILGGGLPAAGFGGSTALMEMVAPSGDVYQAGTLSGNPLATAAGLATLALLDAPAYARLTAVTEQLAGGLQRAADEAGVDLVVHSVPGLLTAFFTSEPPRDFAGAMACDTEAYAAFHGGMLARGVYAPASQFEAWFPSIAHSPEQVEQTLEAATATFAGMAG